MAKNQFHYLQNYGGKMKDILMAQGAVVQGTVVKWTYQPVNVHLKPEATSFHGKSYKIPHANISIENKEVYILEAIGVLKRFVTD